MKKGAISSIPPKGESRAQVTGGCADSPVGEFRYMADAFPDCLLVLDEQNRISWFNTAANQLLGLRAQDDLGQTVTNLLRDPAFANWIAVEQRVESPLEMSSPLDNNIVLSASTVHYREDQKLLILRDVTEVRNLERVRHDFIANVSHELRTPLTVLLGYLESIQDECPEQMTQAVGRMLDQAVKMRILLDDLITLSRLQSDSHPGDEESIVDVPAMLSQLREEAEELSQGRHELRFMTGCGPWLRGTSKDLLSAFRNTINNAIHYTPRGGQITVRWNAVEDGARFSVEDSGIGIPKREIPRLTERFYRVGSDRSRHTGGSGLGLAIVKHVLNAHQARLVINSELGEGSLFRFEFPIERVANPDH